MVNSNLKTTKIITICTDLLFVSISWILAYFLRFYSFISAEKGIPNWALYLKLLPFIIVIWFITLTATGFYKRIFNYHSPFFEGIDAIQSCLLASLMFIVTTYFYEEYRYSRLTLFIFMTLHPLMLIFGRSLIRKGLRLYKRRTPPRKVLIIANNHALNDAFIIEKESYYENIEFIGIILLDEIIGSSKKDCRGIKICSTPNDWVEFFTKNPCESVVISISHQYHVFLDKHLEAIAGQVTDIKVLPDFKKVIKFASAVEMINNNPVISIHESPLQGLGSLFKRILDIIGSIFALIIFSPLMLVISLMVRASSRGPIFYSQERMGLDGKCFSILKFRSMPIDAEKKSGAVWATGKDNRPTKFGSFLRKSSLDELPQFWNVLRGDMSLVGPRPERPIFVNQFRHNIPGYMLRHKVKAGITGWAQIKGWRGNTSIDKRIECDLYYIQNWSLWLDIKILCLTVIKGFIHPNAY